LKNEAKTFANVVAEAPASPRQHSKSFLVLFFKKEPLRFANVRERKKADQLSPVRPISASAPG
jgi:hypothetical protein